MAQARAKQSGMTLVEMLVVLAIVAVAAGAVALGIGAGSRESGIETEAVRLADRLQLAADQSMTDDRRMALVWDRASYGFAGLDSSGRPVGSGPDLLDRHRLPGGMTLAVEPRQPVIPIDPGDRDGRLTARLAEGGRAVTIDYDGIRAVLPDAAR